MPPVINVAMLERAFKKMDEDGNGTLDRNEIKQLMQIMEPRRGITNEELDEAMVEIDTSGDGLVDFEEFKAYWEKNINEGGGVLAGVMTRAGSLCQTSSDVALNQVKENRAQIDALVAKWALDKPVEAEVKVNVLAKDVSDLTQDDLRGQSEAVLNAVLKRCAKDSREYKMVQTMVNQQTSKAQAGGAVVLKDGTKLDKSWGKYMDMGPGALTLDMKAKQKNLKKLKKAKKSPANLQLVEAAQKEHDTVQKIFDDKVQYSGVLSKKGGKKGTKGIDERWFALENVDGARWVLEYYHPKKFTLLGEIPVDEHCLIDRSDDGDTYNLDVTCTEQGRTYYMLTADKEARDTWYKLICEDAGVKPVVDEDDAEDDIADGGENDDDVDEIALEEAATKIQAAARGRQERKAAAARVPEGVPPAAEEEEVDEDDLE